MSHLIATEVGTALAAAGAFRYPSPNPRLGNKENVTCNNHTEILEVDLFAFAYRLFHEEISPLEGAP